jgi:hypothetical protein
VTTLLHFWIYELIAKRSLFRCISASFLYIWFHFSIFVVSFQSLVHPYGFICFWLHFYLMIHIYNENKIYMLLVYRHNLNFWTLHSELMKAGPNLYFFKVLGSGHDGIRLGICLVFKQKVCKWSVYIRWGKLLVILCLNFRYLRFEDQRCGLWIPPNRLGSENKTETRQMQAFVVPCLQFVWSRYYIILPWADVQFVVATSLC